VKLRRWIRHARAVARERAERRADLERRVSRARLAAAGLSEKDVSLAMRLTYDVWRERRPWRWLPGRVQLVLFGIAARRQVAERASRMRR
jgi:hypothetical protein